jgi:cell wall-associated NlpC family hydrolase
MRIIGEPFTAAERAAAITAARGCLGVPWRHMGRAGLPWGHQVGLDCIGLIGVAVHAAGREWRDQPYGTEPNGTLLPLMDEHLGERTGPVPCSVVAIRFAGQARHVALLTDADTLIHCYDGGPSRVVEHIFDETWRKRVVAGWAL